MDVQNIDLGSQKVLAENIKAYIELNSIDSVEAFATLAGTTKTQIYNIYKGHTSPKVDFLDKLATAMGITVPQLLTEGYFSQFEKKIVKKKT
jgi:transcriptional regulator with XRE-family HTH domain